MVISERCAEIAMHEACGIIIGVAFLRGAGHNLHCTLFLLLLLLMPIPTNVSFYLCPAVQLCRFFVGIFPLLVLCMAKSDICCIVCCRYQGVRTLAPADYDVAVSVPEK